MTKDQKKKNLFVVLAGLFLTNALLAELIGVKIFSLERSLGFEPAQIKLFGEYLLDFNLTAGAVIWPVVFITTDLINEYFGKSGVRKISFMAVAFISYSFIIITLVSSLSPAPFWQDVNAQDKNGLPFDINFAFEVIYRQGLGIIIGSLVAFLIGQLVDVVVFQKLRKVTNGKFIWLRATGSTLVSQLIDSYVVLFLAFFVLSSPQNRWELNQVIAVGSINYLYKFGMAIFLTPLIYLGHFLIDKYLGKDLAHDLTSEASK